MKYIAVILLVLLALTAPVFAADSPQQVAIQGFAFNPPALTVTVGTQVTWTNRDQDPHTVVSSTQVFRSGPLDTGESFSFTFIEPGTYKYFCSLHPTMVGSITVVPAP